jgi:hypothetical protein
MADSGCVVGLLVLHDFWTEDLNYADHLDVQRGMANALCAWQTTA